MKRRIAVIAALMGLVASLAYAQSTRYPASGGGGITTPVSTANGGTDQTSWTAGSVPYLSSSTQFGQDNSNFFWDGSNHRLGIGTNAPGFPLDVSGTINTSVVDFGTFIQAGGLQLARHNNNYLLLQTSGISFLQFENDGAANAFITAKHSLNLVLGVDGTSASTGVIVQGASGQTADLLDVEDSSSNIDLAVQAGGNVGIDTSAPKAPLDVHGSIRYGVKYAAGSPPVACSSTVDGLTFLSTTYHLCVCKGSSTAYVLVSDGSTSCS